MSRATIALLALAAAAGDLAAQTVDVARLLAEMVDLEGLAARPVPWFRHAQASSYDRRSHQGGDDWFANYDVGQYVRTETRDGRTEHVLADLRGPGTVTRFWSANPGITNPVRFYFDGEERPRMELPFAQLFAGSAAPFGPAFSYVSGTGGNLYFPLPYARSLRITVEELDRPLRLYYEIGHRTYEDGTAVATFDPAAASAWRDTQTRVAAALSRPQPTAAAAGPEPIRAQWTIPAGESRSLPALEGAAMVRRWSARVAGTRESRAWDDPLRAHNAYRALLLEVSFDGEPSIACPLGDFFGSAPGVNGYENLLFTVAADGTMTSRLCMPFARSMELRLTNAGRVPYTVELELDAVPHPFTERSLHLRAQWRTWSRDTWPPFDVNLLATTGEGKLVGSTYQIANPVLIWWGEGDQKITVDGEAFPSTFGTGTEDDYGYAYGYNRPFVRPFHAQTRVDGPASGGNISLNRWYVLDALPYRTALRFDQEIWHWMPCRPTWTSVVYWYARPGAPGPMAIDRQHLAPVDLGIRADMLEPLEGELLRAEATGGKAEPQRLANCSRAEQLLWHGASPGDRLTLHFEVPVAGRYRVRLNLCMAPDYGRQRLSINGAAVAPVVDGYAPRLYWMQPDLGVFELAQGDNKLEVEALAPNPKATPGNLFGLDYVFLVRQ